MAETNVVRATIEAGKAFAIVCRRGEQVAHMVVGQARELADLESIPRKSGKPDADLVFDSITAVPFAQVRERGFRAHDDGARILCIEAEQHLQLEVDDLLAQLPRETIHLREDVTYDLDDDDYAEVVRKVVEDEIGNGEGANFVIRRTAFARIDDFDTHKALSVFRKLLEREYGSYWTFFFCFEGLFLIGATPERHLEVKGNCVRMNPISGTFRKAVGGDHSLVQFKKKLVEFLGDRKEINELFMVVDEELKMMARLCTEGGMVIGPLLKEMSSLLHTEYLLSGHSTLDIIDLLRETMFAATVTGGPIENACTVIERHEKSARRYYASTIALIGRDSLGRPYLDSPITIRTLELDSTGNVSFSVGATLVRDSKPADEVEETKAKARAVLTSLSAADNDRPRPAAMLPLLHGDDDINEALQTRNQHLSKFWFFEQDVSEEEMEALQGQRITIVDFEDDFCYMLGHILKRMGCTVTVERFSRFNFDPASTDLVIVGPGPGNPSDIGSAKMARGMELVTQLHESQAKFACICLGHQLLCRVLGIPLARKRFPFQGTQETIMLFGRQVRVGFYNTFTGVYQDPLADCEVAFDPETKEIHALRSARFLGLQFHAESILTKNGHMILRDMLARLFAG